MNTHYENRAPSEHSHRSHPVSLLSTAVASADKAFIDAAAVHEDIQLCAFYKWESAGKPSGNEVPFWLEAEREITEGQRETTAGRDDRHTDQSPSTPAVGEQQDAWGRGNSQDADRHSGIRHPRSVKV
jgi:hypothetical protein